MLSLLRGVRVCVRVIIVSIIEIIISILSNDDDEGFQDYSDASIDPPTGCH